MLLLRSKTEGNVLLLILLLLVYLLAEQRMTDTLEIIIDSGIRRPSALFILLKFFSKHYVGLYDYYYTISIRNT